ncbi:MAG: hypothetical protein VZQ27_01350 [Candidatus Cryptobacteroides sp.]|nr:hypothetical protein [Candidatus Cryptobacteroides sp.]
MKHPFKRSLSLAVIALGTLLPSVSSHAQMPSDSLVQLVAYWELGDKFSYNTSTTKSQIVGKDTTVVEYETDITTYEVVAADDKMYRLRYTTSNESSNNPLYAPVYDVIHKLTALSPIEFETDELGSFQRMLPLEWDKLTDAALEEFINGAVEKNDTLKEGKEMFSNMLRSLIQPSTFQMAYQSSIEETLKYHGLQYKIGEEYSYQYESPNLFVPDGNTITMNCVYWIDEDNTDEDFLTIRSYQEADQDDFKETVKTMLQNVIGSIGEDFTENMRTELENALDSMDVSITTDGVSRFHRGSGWPVYSYQIKEVLINLNGAEYRHELTENESEIILD